MTVPIVASHFGRKIRPLRMNKKIEQNIPIPMDIDLVYDNDSKSLATVNGEIKDIIFPIICDSGSNISVMPIECAEELKLEINTEKNYALSGVATEKETIGIVHSVHITLAPDCTIIEDFVVVKGHYYRELVLSRTCLKRYNYDLLESRGHMAITCDEKNYFIPFISINREKI